MSSDEQEEHRKIVDEAIQQNKNGIFGVEAPCVDRISGLCEWKSLDEHASLHAASGCTLFAKGEGGGDAHLLRRRRESEPSSISHRRTFNSEGSNCIVSCSVDDLDLPPAFIQASNPPAPAKKAKRATHTQLSFQRKVSSPEFDGLRCEVGSENEEVATSVLRASTPLQPTVSFRGCSPLSRGLPIFPIGLSSRTLLSSSSSAPNSFRVFTPPFSFPVHAPGFLPVPFGLQTRFHGASRALPLPQATSMESEHVPPADAAVSQEQRAATDNRNHASIVCLSDVRTINHPVTGEILRSSIDIRILLNERPFVLNPLTDRLAHRLPPLERDCKNRNMFSDVENFYEHHSLVHVGVIWVDNHALEIVLRKFAERSLLQEFFDLGSDCDSCLSPRVGKTFNQLDAALQSQASTAALSSLSCLQQQVFV